MRSIPRSWIWLGHLGLAANVTLTSWRSVKRLRPQELVACQCSSPCLFLLSSPQRFWGSSWARHWTTHDESFCGHGSLTACWSSGTSLVLTVYLPGTNSALHLDDKGWPRLLGVAPEAVETTPDETVGCNNVLNDTRAVSAICAQKSCFGTYVKEIRLVFQAPTIGPRYTRAPHSPLAVEGN